MVLRALISFLRDNLGCSGIAVLVALVDNLPVFIPEQIGHLGTIPLLIARYVFHVVFPVGQQNDHGLVCFTFSPAEKDLVGLHQSGAYIGHGRDFRRVLLIDMVDQVPPALRGGNIRQVLDHNIVHNFAREGNNRHTGAFHVEHADQHGRRVDTVAKGIVAPVVFFSHGVGHVQNNNHINAGRGRSIPGRLLSRGKRHHAEQQAHRK